MKTFFFLLSLVFSFPALASSDYHIYINADFSYNKSSAESIYKGVYLAFKNNQFKIQDKKIKIIKCDHRGINHRSDKCVKRYLKDNKALVMYGGLHSPPLISNIKKKNSGYNINEEKVLTLIPWAAAGIITRMKGENWIYRLSVDDKYAGKYILSEALKEDAGKLGLLLINDGWGRFNKKAMEAKLKSKKITDYEIRFFDRDISEASAKAYLDDFKKNNVKTIILVGNAPQGEKIFKAMYSLGLHKTMRVRSHWGITGGDIWNNIGNELKAIDLKVIQTSFSFNSDQQTKYSKKVLKQLIAEFNDIENKTDLKSPVGFIHAYDLTKILIEASHKVKLSGDTSKDKYIIKKQLENMNWSVQGLIKKYKSPFKNINSNIDGHDALRIGDFRMFKYSNSGILIP